MSNVNSFKDYINKYDLGYLLENVSFKCLTSLGVGGSCSLLYLPSDFESLEISIKYLIKNNIKYFIIGCGTNLLVDDKFFDIVVISLRKLRKYNIVDEDKNNYYIYVEAGLRAPCLSKYLIENNIFGVEFLSIIPGSIGGLTYMNAGAYNKSMADIIHKVTYIDNFGNIICKENNNNNFHFSYRSSIFKKKHYIVISVELKISKTNLKKEESCNIIKNYIDKKKSTQPLQNKNAGSTFINDNNIKTWQLIDEIGFRGYNIGDAEVSNKHTNFIINKGNATFNDMIQLINLIKENVYKKFNIKLKCEWEILS